MITAYISIKGTDTKVRTAWHLCVCFNMQLTTNIITAWYSVYFAAFISLAPSEVS